MVAVRKCYRDGGRVLPVEPDPPADPIASGSPAPPSSDLTPLQRALDATIRAEERNHAAALAHSAEQARAAALSAAVATGNLDQVLASMPGLIDAERDWLRARPEALRHLPALTSGFSEAMTQGIKRGSSSYFTHLEQVIERSQSGAPPSSPSPATAVNPVSPELAAALGDSIEIARRVAERNAPPAPPPRSIPVSAPVSREAPSMTGHPTDVDPSRVKLSPEERSVAAQLGVSEIEYARNKVEMMARKRAGLMQD